MRIYDQQAAQTPSCWSSLPSFLSRSGARHVKACALTSFMSPSLFCRCVHPTFVPGSVYCIATGNSRLPSAHEALLCHSAACFCMKLSFHSIDIYTTCIEYSFSRGQHEKLLCCFLKKFTLLINQNRHIALIFQILENKKRIFCLLSFLLPIAAGCKITAACMA